MGYENRIEEIETVAEQQRRFQRERADVERRDIENAREQSPEIAARELGSPLGFWAEPIREEQQNDERIGIESAREERVIEQENNYGMEM